MSFADWYGGYDLSSYFKNVKKSIDHAYHSGAPTVGTSTHKLLRILRLRMSKHPVYVNREDNFSWIRHDIVLFRQLRKNFRTRKNFYGRDGLLDAVAGLEKKYKKILRLRNKSEISI